jgi:tetratricopeptide (TPR) repeat protein
MSSSEIVLEKIPSLLDSEKEEEAIELLSQLITSHPELAEAYLLRGNAYRQLRQWGPALSDYERVVALKPDCAAAHLYQGVVFGKRLNHQEALRCCNTALSLTPDFAEAYYWRGRANYELGHYLQSLTDLNEALRLQPTFPEAMAFRWTAQSKCNELRLLPPVIDFSRHFPFSKLFKDMNEPISVKSPHGKLECRWVEIDPLYIHSGGVTACDPLHTHHVELSLAVKPGTYPVRLLIASFKKLKLTLESTNEQLESLIACAAVILSDSAPVSWELLTYADGSKCYDTDSGFGCFVDQELARDDGLGSSPLGQTFDALSELEKKVTHTEGCPWANVKIDSADGANVVAFKAGFGTDPAVGNYATYVGRDKQNEPAVLLQDFWLLDEKSEAVELTPA